jgi:2-iminobutanoate/2-iminopropanoate deaminase
MAMPSGQTSAASADDPAPRHRDTGVTTPEEGHPMTITKTTQRSGPFADFFCNGVKVGDHLYLAGNVSIDEHGTVGPGDITAQMTQCYANIAATLAEFDADMSSVVDETVFVTDVADFMANLDTIAPAREAAFGTKPEVSQTLVQVASLVDPGWLIEIKAVARL